MKLLFVSGNLCNGGAQRVISVVSSKLADKGHDVSLILFARNEKEYPLSNKVKIYSLGDNFEEYSKLSEFKRVKMLRALLNQIKPEAAVGFLEGGYGLYLSSFGMKFPKIASARIDPVQILNAKGVRAKINLRWFASADAVVLQTNEQADHVKHMNWKNKTVIANPVSQAALEYPEHDYERPCKRLVMAGRLDDQKNYKMAITAMKTVHESYPDVILDIFGKGKEEEDLRAFIMSNGLEGCVTLKGWTQNVADEYAKSDIYLMTSDCEGMPNALMEAMAIGLPCISTDCPTGPADLICDGENGYLVPVNDAAALADRVMRLVEMSSEDRRAMGESARKYLSDNFNRGYIAEQWERLLERLVKKK